MKFKSSLSEYTEPEFFEIISELFEGPVDVPEDQEEQYITDLIDHIAGVTEHPEKSGLLCYPPADREDSAKGVMQEIKAWRARSGKPGFKQPD